VETSTYRWGPPCVSGLKAVETAVLASRKGDVSVTRSGRCIARSPGGYTPSTWLSQTLSPHPTDFASSHPHCGGGSCSGVDSGHESATGGDGFGGGDGDSVEGET